MTTLISIDKNIPIPAKAQGAPRLPFGTMVVGDSFFSPGKKAESFGGQRHRLSKKGWRFTTRSITENGVSGVRVWRTE